MDLQELDSRYILPTYAKNYVNFKSAKSATIVDTQNKEYIDFGSGIGVVSVGHSHPKVIDAISTQASEIIHISNLYAIEPQAKLAQKIVQMSGYSDMQLFFANSGAEANEGAIKIARKYGEVDNKPKRYKIITLKNSFHGRTISTLKATGQESMHNYFGPFPDGFVYANSIDSVKEQLDDHTIAVMIELVQGEGGVEPLDKEAVQNLAKELKKRDILLIVDEVQTGIYRTGEFLASHLYGITPDIITLAKGLGGGVPIGSVMSRVTNLLKAGDHGSTFGGNYLVTRTALEVLDILYKHKSSGGLDNTISYFNKKIEDIAKSYDIVQKVVGVGLMLGLRIDSSENLTKLIDEGFDQGVLLLKAGKNSLRFLPPLTITKAEIDEGFKRVEKTFNTIS
jgi:acetylornithine aminotransferase